MIVRERPGTLGLLFAVRGTIFIAIYPRILWLLGFSFLIQMIHAKDWISIPEYSSAPFALLGVAMSIFLGFRNNAAYDRWWEGRKQWGQMIHEIRSIGRISDSLMYGHNQERRQLLCYIAAYSHALRGRLRQQDVSADIARWIGEEEAQHALIHSNVPDFCLREGGRIIGKLHREGVIDSIGLQMLNSHLSTLAVIQAASERLARNRMPFGYTVLAHRIAYLYCYLLPFGLVASLGWLTPVFTVLMGYTFFGLDELSEQLEEPFGFAPNDLALEALCRSNEISIAECLGDVPPAPTEPVNFILK